MKLLLLYNWNVLERVLYSHKPVICLKVGITVRAAVLKSESTSQNGELGCVVVQVELIKGALDPDHN